MPERSADYAAELDSVAWRQRLRANVAASLRGTVLRGARPVPVEPSGVITTGPGTLMGLNLTAGADAAVVRLYDGERPDVSGDPIQTVRIPAGRTRTRWFGPSGISVQRGLYVQTGASVGVVVADPANLTPGDVVVATTLADAGYAVRLTDDNAAIPVGLDGFVLCESGSPANHLAQGYPALALPVVTLEVGGWDDFGMTTVNGTTAAPTITGWDLQPHAITANLPDPVTMWGGLTRAAWGAADIELAAGVTVFAKHPSVATHNTGFTVETGAALTVGNAPARRAAGGLVDSTVDDIGPDGKRTLLAMTGWALGAAGAVEGYAYLRGSA